MEPKFDKPKLKESTDNMDLIRMIPEVAFLDSLTKSKTLLVMTIVLLTCFSGFFYFLYKMATN